MKLLRCTAVLILVAGCSNSSSISDSNSGTVHAQSGFSNASVNGSYGWQFSGRIGTAGAVTASVLGTGTLVANGGVFNGGFSETMVNISNGAITVCSGTVSGSYSVGPDGTGTASINPVVPPAQNGPGPCAFTSTATFHLVIAYQGHTVVFTSNDGNNSMDMALGQQ